MKEEEKLRFFSRRRERNEHKCLKVFLSKKQMSHFTRITDTPSVPCVRPDQTNKHYVAVEGYREEVKNKDINEKNNCKQWIGKSKL